MSDTINRAKPVLEVRDLRLHYFTSKGPVRALDGLSFSLRPGETLGLVGESGCGKTTTGLALLGMPSPPGRIVSGSILLDGTEIVGLSDRELRRQVRWSKISMVFQGAMNCLTPVYTIRGLMAETYREHVPSIHGQRPSGQSDAPSGPLDEAGLETLMQKYLRLVGLPVSVLGRYPHELSGGMKQRVVIAMALFLEPKVIVMDEPTTALDVIVQAQILNLIKELRCDLGLSYVFITHDLATEAEIADRIMVMYAGKMAELGSNEEIFGSPGGQGDSRSGYQNGPNNPSDLRSKSQNRSRNLSDSRSESQSGPRRGPLHPYTQKLLASTPRLHRRVSELAFIPGSPPDLIAPPEGCRFAPRCAFAKPKCSAAEPPVAELGPDHLVACWKAMEDPEYESS
jgi:peptide/nickel transport system ATP-binding protein